LDLKPKNPHIPDSLSPTKSPPFYPDKAEMEIDTLKRIALYSQKDTRNVMMGAFE